MMISPSIPCPPGRQMYSSYILQKIFFIVTTLAQLNAMVVDGTKLQVSPAHPMDKWPKLTTHALWSSSWLSTSSTSTTTSKNYNNSNNSKQDLRNCDFLVALGTEPTSALWATYGLFWNREMYYHFNDGHCVSCCFFFLFIVLPQDLQERHA